MKFRIVKTVIFALIHLGIVSCKTYHIPLDSFNDQLKDIDNVELKTVKTKGPMGDVVSYETYPIEFINCIDNNNEPIQLKNSPSIEIRFTDKNNKHTTFYFDQIYIQDSTVFGDGSRFINYKKEIRINNIKLIEVQDGLKNFKYVKKKK